MFQTLLVVPAWGNELSADATVNSSAHVVRMLAVASTSDLKFGTFSAGSSAGTVSVGASGNRSATGGVRLINSTQVAQQATVSLIGTPSTTFSVSLPSAVSLAALGSGVSMGLANFVSNLSAGQGILNADGTASFGVGGTLSVASNQAPAVYVGRFTVTLNYN